MLVWLWNKRALKGWGIYVKFVSVELPKDNFSYMLGWFISNIKIYRKFGSSFSRAIMEVRLRLLDTF